MQKKMALTIKANFAYFTISTQYNYCFLGSLGTYVN